MSLDENRALLELSRSMEREGDFSTTDTIVDNAWSRKLGVDGC